MLDGYTSCITTFGNVQPSHPSRGKMQLVPFLLLFLLFPVHTLGECVARLPTAANIGSSVRIINGLDAAPDDVKNIVTIAVEQDEGIDYICVGSLIAPNWVLTAAQCFIRPGSNFVLHGGTSLTGTRYDIVQAFSHPGYAQAGQQVHRDDIQLVRLGRAVSDTLLPSPFPSPLPSGAPAEEPQPVSEQPQPVSEQPPEINKGFHFMYINNNTDFAMDQPRYLRLKGYGITIHPNSEGEKEPLTLQTRTLRFADLRTSDCDDNFGNDDKRRLCTQKDNECGACFGDVGAPLYDVDSSGTFSVLVGIVTFGQQATAVQTPIVCTGERPVAYTAVARYAEWITETIKKQSEDETLFFFQLPKEGITNTDLARDTSPLAIFATTSVIVIACLALLGTTVTVIVTCVLRHMRKKRKRWQEGLQAEESFVKAGEKEAIIVDPFEGIQEDQQPRFSFTGFSRAAVKGATEFSSRSIGILKAIVAREKDEEFMEAREAIDGAPVWVSTAWDKLFMAPSKRDLRKIHTIPTQRVVDDVLSGADKSVELSLEEVAYKSKRDEANLEAAWAKLEIQTSLRNLSEAGGSTANLFTPARMSPSMSPLAASPRKGSRNSSRIISRLGSEKRDPGDLTKADTLLAAFASIDAESEQVAEETTIDSSALRALAEMKRPNVLATLRRKFSSGLSSPVPRSSDRESDGKEESNSVLDSRGPGQLNASGSRLGSGPNSRILTALSNTSGVMANGSLGSRQSSMMKDYFSETYSISSDEDEDGDHIAFEDIFEADYRRYTEDRKPQTEYESRSILGFRSIRKSQNRSFESLDRNRSSENLSFATDTGYLARSSGSQRDSSDTNSRHERSANLPISSSSLSSEKRPRSSASRSHGGSSYQRQEYSEFNWRDEGEIIVQMEDQPSLPAPSSLPDRADDRRTQQASTSALSPSANSGTVTRQPEQAPGSDDISVYMEEEISYGHTGNDVLSEKPVNNYYAFSSGAGSSKDRRLHSSDKTRKESHDVTSVYEEEPSRDAEARTPQRGIDLSKQTRDPSAQSTKPSASTVIPTPDNAAEDMISVYMEQEPSYGTREAARRKGDRAVTSVDAPVRKQPTSEMEPSKIPWFRNGDTVSVHMEDETSPRPSVRARISEFDESEKRARRLSEPSSTRVRRESNVSVEKLKSMWNEIARRNSEDSYLS